MSLVVAIDGASGSGKSTLARALASRLGLAYLNTGMMYRAVAATALRDGIDPDDAAALAGIADGIGFRVAPGSPPALEVEGWTEAELMTLEVEAVVSAVARHPAVRVTLRRAQRELGGIGAVVEGRDIGTVVFPEAPVKLFLEAAPEVRIDRRAEERGARPDETADALLARDRRDARTTPATAAADAVVIETTTLDEAATLEAALAVVAERVGGS